MSKLIPDSIRKNGVNKAVKSAIRRVTGTSKFIQHTALFCLESIKEHGNWTPARDLIVGISKCNGANKSRLTKYFEAMMSASLVYDKEAKEYRFEYDEGKSGADINLDMASAVNWFDFKPEPTDNTRDLDAILRTTLNSVEKSVESGKVTANAQRIISEAIEAGLKAIAEAEAAERIAEAA